MGEAAGRHALPLRYQVVFSAPPTPKSQSCTNAILAYLTFVSLCDII